MGYVAQIRPLVLTVQETGLSWRWAVEDSSQPLRSGDHHTVAGAKDAAQQAAIEMLDAALAVLRGPGG